MPTPSPRSVPRLRQPWESSAKRSRTASASRTAFSSCSSTATGSLKNTISPSPAKCSSVAVMGGDQLSDHAVILPENSEQLLGLRRLDKRSEAAQVAEQYGDVRAVSAEKDCSFG